MKFNKIIIPKRLIQKTKDKILNAVKKDDLTGCWVLTKYFHHNKNDGKFSYCKMSINNNGLRSYYFVHRLSYHLFKEEIPDGALILHKCNNYKCCNPDHLYPGDHKQNVIDCKNAGHENKAVGERNNKCKLKEADIEKIFILRGMGFSHNQISRLYKVAPGSISKILSGETWGHLNQGGSDEHK